MPWSSRRTIDHMVLFSGDGDFRSLVEAVQRRGVRVTVVSTISTQPPMVADELRRQADIFIDIVELQGKIGRDPSERAARERAGRASDRGERRSTRRNSCSAAPAPQRAPAPATMSTIDDEESVRITPAWLAIAAKPGRDCPRCPRLVGVPPDMARATSRPGSTRRCPRSGRSTRGC